MAMLFPDPAAPRSKNTSFEFPLKNLSIYSNKSLVERFLFIYGFRCVVFIFKNNSFVSSMSSLILMDDLLLFILFFILLM